jgi:hypothetical protein
MRAAVMSGVEPGSTRGNPQRGAVRGGEKLHVAAERLVFLAEPQVVAVLADAGDAVGLDQRPVQNHVGHPLLLAACQDPVQLRGLVCEDVDPFVGVAVAGGLGDSGVAGQAVHAAALAEPAQHQHGLTERARRPAAVRRAQPAALAGQQAGEVFHHVARDVEGGAIGDRRGASGRYVHDLVA